MRRAHDQRMHHYTMGVKRGIAILTAPHVGPSALGAPLRTACHTRRLFPTFFPPVCRTQARVRHLKERQSHILVARSLLSASPLGQEIRRFLGQFTNYCKRKYHSFTDQKRYFNTKRRLRAFVALCTLLSSDRTSWAWLLWRVMERALRRPVDTTRTPWPGWATHATERPTSCMMSTQCAGVIVWPLGPPRPRARPRARVQPQSLTALDGPVAGGPTAQSGSGDGEDAGTPRTAAQASPVLVGRRAPATPRQDHEQSPGTWARPPARPGEEQAEPPDRGSTGLAGHGSLVGRERRLPAAPPSGSAMGLPLCMQV